MGRRQPQAAYAPERAGMAFVKVLATASNDQEDHGRVAMICLE